MTSTVNDSGISTPSKCLEGDEEFVHFFIDWPSRGKQEVVAETSKSVAEALKFKFNTTDDEIESLLFYAELTVPIDNPDNEKSEIIDNHKKAFVNPFLVSCASLRPETTIEVQACKEINYGKQKLKSREKCEPKSKAAFFFISTLDRKNRRGIMYVPLHKFQWQCEFAVLAFPGQSFIQALDQDGRFKDVHNFKLVRKEERPEIGLTDQPGLHFKKELLVLCVELKDSQSVDVRNSVSQVSESRSSTSATEAGTSTSEADVSETPKKKAKKLPKLSKSKLSEQLWKENVVYVFPEGKEVKDLTDEEMMFEMRKCLMAETWSTLLGPKDRVAAKKYKRSIASLGKREFANQHILSRPVSFSKKITPLFDSIAYIECGDITATGFLVSNDMIITSNHVVERIKKASKSSTNVNYKDVKVSFDFEEHGSILDCKYQLLPFNSEGNIFSLGLDYAFVLLDKQVESRITLGQFVSTNVPDSGKVVIIGHPFGREKQDEICAILPLHEERRSLKLQKRIRKQEQKHCNENPSNCQLTSTSQDTRCVHAWREQIQQLPGNQSVVMYDVGSMFEGSSGSPVFDMGCNIFALHTLGFRVGKSSIVEVGVTFEAIIHDLERNGHADFVERMFPNCKLEEMDQDT